MSFGFVHLRLHSEYSLSDGLVKLEPLIARCRELKLPAVALTDQANLFGMIKFYKAALRGGIKPIVGADLWVFNPENPKLPDRLTLLVQNRQGFRNLTALLTRAYLEGQTSLKPCIQADWLDWQADGLIALSGAREGEIGRLLLAEQKGKAKAALQRWLDRFADRFFLELQRTFRPYEEEYLEGALELASELGVPVVATNDVRFLRREDFEAHEARVCIHEGWTLDDPKRPRPYSEHQYLKSAEEMREIFSDLPEALANTLEIAKRCNLLLELGKPHLPAFPVPEGFSLEQHLARIAEQGLEARIKAGDIPEDKRAVYAERLKMELEVIARMGFCGYFLIVADFIRWAKQNGIPVGPGRGSGAGSLVAYALGITELDPIAFDLLFERFLNPERVSMPDFDVDFCMERRDEVIAYVAEKYGRDKVAQIITFGTMAAKAVVRDVGRVLGHPYGFVDRLAKLIPFELGMTLDKALAESEDLRRAYEQDEAVKELIDLARQLEGVARNAGKHAGGVVIAPSQLTDFTPLYREPDEAGVVTQFDKDDVEAVGLVKFDFLGLRTLTIIAWAVETINQKRLKEGLEPLDIQRIPRADPLTFALLQSGKTTGVFQLESRGMKDLIRRLQPDCFDDIVALVALFRPGPLQSGMVDDYINVKHRRTQVSYPHPLLEPILRPTNGVILYQEQVMQIARDLAGYTLGGADLLRRAMGKKKPEEMTKHRVVFVQGAVERGVPEQTAHYIFDLMEKFAGYGFNKSHSAAYAWVSYQTAWLKAHYPAAFMAAVLSADMDHTDKLVSLVDECRSLGLKLLPPDVQRSGFRFIALSESEILYGLGAIKGVGQAAVEAVIEAREGQGLFRDLFDLCLRVDPQRVNRRALEALIRAGAMDSLGLPRAELFALLPQALQAAEQSRRTLSQNDLFAVPAVDGGSASHRPERVEIQPWSKQRLLEEERAVLGLYLSGHPLDTAREELRRFTLSLGELERLDPKPQSCTVGGWVMELRTRRNKQGKRMAFAVLDDGTGRLEVAMYPETLEKVQVPLAKDQVWVVQGGLEEYAEGYRLVAEKVLTLAQAREQFAKGLWILWLAEKPKGVKTLHELLRKHRGGRCPVYIDYRGRSACAQLKLGESWSIHPEDELLESLSLHLGPERVSLRYD
jgi:DNA polymerase-3 subunit alpha